MKTIYLDSNFCCHLFLKEPYLTIETSVFDNKCQTYIEGYRFVPMGYTWIDSNGEEFHGQMVSPFINYNILKSAQEQYDNDQISYWSSLSFSQEKDFCATRNYLKDEYLSIQGEVYKTITTIPDGCSFILYQNIIPSTIQDYLDSLKEEQ